MTLTPEPRPAMPAESGVGRQVAAGAAWFMAMRWLVRLIGLMSTIVLARVLVPEDFGLIAIATSYIALLDAFVDVGSRDALIRHDTKDRRFIDTVFTAQSLRGMGIGALTFASGFVLPGFVGDARLGPVIWCIALHPVLVGHFSPAMVYFERQLNFRRELVVQVSAKIIGTTMAIGCAFAFRSYWALVFGILTDATVRLTISYLMAPYKPSVTLSRWRELFRFSGWLSGASLFTALAQRLDDMFVGMFLGVGTAGFYNIGQQLGAMPLGEFLPVVNRALFPGLMKFKDDSEKLRSNSLGAFEFLSAISLPMAVGFSLVAGDFVRLLYGDKWIDAIVIVQLVSICAGIQTLGTGVANSLAMAKSHTKMMFYRAASFFAIRAPIFLLGTWLFGLTGALVGTFIGSVVLAIANVSILCSLLRIGYAEILSRIWRAIISTAAMALAVYGLSLQMTTWQMQAGTVAIALFAKILAGAVTYGSTRWLLWRLTGRMEIFEERLVGFVRSRLSRI